MDVKMLQCIDDDHQYHYWYGGNCAEISHKGYKLYVAAIGDVKVDFVVGGVVKESFKDTRNSGTFYKRMAYYIKNDKELNDSIENRSLIISNNNWWELTMVDRNNKFHDLGMVLDSYFLKEAVSEAQDIANDIIDMFETE